MTTVYGTPPLTSGEASRLAAVAIAKMLTGDYDIVLRGKPLRSAPVPEFIDFPSDVAVRLAELTNIGGRSVYNAKLAAGKSPPEPAPKLSEVQAEMRRQVEVFMDTTVDGSSIELLWLFIQRNRL